MTSLVPATRSPIRSPYIDREILTSLAIPLYNPGFVTLIGMIYVLGGLNNHHQSTNALQRYDPQSKSWAQLAPLPVKRGEYEICAMNDLIYAYFYSKVYPYIASEDLPKYFVSLRYFLPWVLSKRDLIVSQLRCSKEAGDKRKMDGTLPKRELLNADHFTKMILPNINDFRKTMKYCDINIIVDGVEFAAHKLMLAGFSPYFKTFFSGSFPESKGSSIVMSSIDAPTMGLILDYAYTGVIEITENNVQAVLHAASFLQDCYQYGKPGKVGEILTSRGEPEKVRDFTRWRVGSSKFIPSPTINMLFDECCNFLENNINASNCLGIRHIAKVYSCSNLEKKSWEYSLKYFLQISEEQEFLELDANDLIELLANDALRINQLDEEDSNNDEITEKIAEKCEEHVFEAVVRWLEYKEDERRTALPEILAQVRLAYLSPWFLFDRVETVNAICNTPACTSLVVRALYYSLLHNRRTELQSSISRRRINWLDAEVMLMYGKNGETQKKSMKCIAEDGSFVRKFTTPPVDFEFYVVSNYHNQCVGIHREVMWYQYTQGESENWKSMVHMRKSRRGFGVCELDGLWFVFGGESDSGVCDDVSDYNNCGSWRDVSPLLVAVMQPMAVVTLRGRIYVIGGLDKNYYATSLLQCFDPRHDGWTLLSPLPVIGDFRACVVGDDIYVCQRFSAVLPEHEKASRMVYVYNASKDEWTSGPELRHPFVSGPVSFNGNMMVLTKKDNDEHVLERYTPSSHSWEEITVFPVHESQYIAGPLIIYRKEE